MAIPIQNIYYLLSYAWDRLEERGKVKINAEDHTDLANLFGRVLDNGLNQLFRAGWDRGYVPQRNTLRVVRGQICFSETLRILGLQTGQVVCDYEEMVNDILPNQILKAVLKLLRRAVNNSEIKVLLGKQLSRLHNVSDIRLESQHFTRVVLHRNNQIYGFLLDVCQLIFRNLLPSREPGLWLFSDFTNDPNQLGLLFEHFVRNFYRHHQAEHGFGVSRETINWNWKASSVDSRTLLPSMMTDICMRRGVQKVLIECKFGLMTKSNQYNAERLISSHLYQLNAYLTHLPDKPENIKCGGMLLYPSNGIDQHLEYKVADRRIQIRSLNLDQPWAKIHQDLLRLMNDYA